jgi:hypothetical protein
MIRRDLLAVTMATSLCLAVAGLARAADPSPTQLPPKALAKPVVTSLVLLKASDDSVVALANSPSLVVPNLVKDVNYKLKVFFGTPLSNAPQLKPNPALRQGPIHAATGKADAEAKVTNSTSQQAKVLNPATKPVPGLGAGQSTTVDWEYKATANGQHLFSAKLK